MCVYYEYTVLSNSIFSTFGDKKTYSESITKHSKPLKSFGWLFFFLLGLGWVCLFLKAPLLAVFKVRLRRIIKS